MRLQEWAEAERLGAPVYAVTATGPGHEQRFEATVAIGGVVVASGHGSSKKGAELDAARAAWETRRA